MPEPVRESSLKVFRDYQVHLEGDQVTVFNLLKEIGPQHDLIILDEINKREKKNGSSRVWRINEITGRRNGLIKNGCIFCVGFWRVPAGVGIPVMEGGRIKERIYMYWDCIDEYRTPSVGVKVKDAPENRTRDAVILIGKNTAAEKKRKEERGKSKHRADANKSKMVWEKEGQQKRTRPTNQYGLFEGDTNG